MRTGLGKSLALGIAAGTVAAGTVALAAGGSGSVNGASAAGSPSSARIVTAASSVSFDLCAKAGTVALPGAGSVPIWGFSLKPGGVSCSDASVVATLPGPILDVSKGAAVSVTLHNELSKPVSLRVPGLGDAAEVPAGGQHTYDFDASDPGTYLYQSGTDLERQVPMGLYGALIVRSGTAGQAYDDGGTSAYDQEAVLVLGEIDPALNADPYGFNLLRWSPTYWLINGKAYPDTATIPADAGDRVLLRYVNAGEDHHTMTLLGAHQRIVAKDAYPEPFPWDVVAETIPAGQTADMVAMVPASEAGRKLPLYSRQLHITNGDSFPGGMLTFIDVAPAATVAGGAAPGALPRILGVRSVVRGHRVRILVSQTRCARCAATVRLRVRGHTRFALMHLSAGRFTATFRNVPRGRWSYRVALTDRARGVKLRASRTVSVP